ncbi:MAG: PQQ-binding-like beta-propeller repeat protein, partial [bacterium]|nr:PQQ-binding-like beta-propeller repeat protein [bacterium]
EAANKTGAANAWAPLSADPDRDMVFVPTGSAAPDFYGGERPGCNLYANSVVALRASTGDVLWHFQVVHHDLWVYDVPSQPALTTVTRDGVPRPAIAIATKMGHLFVLDRTTGEPLFPVSERPVPSSDVPGEQAWPTQPFPDLPRPLHPTSLEPEDAWGVTPEEQSFCRQQFEQLRRGGIFAPPSLEGTLFYPG